MSDHLGVPGSRAGSVFDADLGTESSNLSVKKSTVDANTLLMRLAGKPAKKKSSQDLTEIKRKKSENADKKATKTKNQHSKVPRGSIPKEQKVGKQSDHKEKDTDSKNSPKDNGTNDMPDWYEELDDEELASFRELFSMIDQSQSGVITAENLFEEMRRVDSEITFEEVEDVLKKVDKDGSGTIDFDEFLFYLTQMGDEVGGVDDEKKNIYSRRKRLFYSALTQFSLKQTLAELEKTLRTGLRQAPHVISHYTAGARLIGLTTRQLTKEMKKMQQSAAKNDSPYAKPLQFVHMGTKKIVQRRKIKSPSRTRVGQGMVQSQADTDESIDDTEKKADSTVQDISKQIQNQLKLLSQRGSVVAQLPDAQKILEWRQKVSAQLRSETDSPEKQCLAPLGENQVKTESSRKTVTATAYQQHSFVTVRGPDFKGKPKKPVIKKRRTHKGWCTPRIIYLEVPLPSLKMKLKSHKPTFNDLPSIRAKAKNATDIYYHKLRQTEIKNAWEHWDRLYADVIRPKKLLDNFRKVYDAYSPHREEESFVVCPWTPGPFRFLRHNKKNSIQSYPNSPHFMYDGSSPKPYSPKPFKDKNDLVVRPLSSLM